MKENLSTLRLDMVPAMARTLSLKDEVVISDNLDSRVPVEIASRLKKGLSTRTLRPYGMTFPYRVAFHTILFVESGRVDCRINLKDYRIEGCSIFLAASGIVLDSLEYQAGTRLPAACFRQLQDHPGSSWHPHTLPFCCRLTTGGWTGIFSCSG